MTIGEDLGMNPDPRKWRKTSRVADNNTFVGVEVELENLGNFTGPFRAEMTKTNLWSIIKDGSLRNDGLEFVMQTPDGAPVRAGDITRALFRFRKVMRDYCKDYLPPDCSPRTSLHVHMDVRDLTLTELKKLILLYAIFEETFFKWAGPDRIRNNYCRSISFYSDVTERLANILSLPDDDKAVDVLIRELEKGNKYDACNLLSITQRGSMEFRLMGGTYDTKVMLSWINMLLCLKLASKDKGIVIDSFPEDMSMRGVGNLIHQVFGKWGEELIPLATDLDILRGVRKAQDLLLYPRLDELNQQFLAHSAKDKSHLDALNVKLKEV